MIVKYIDIPQVTKLVMKVVKFGFQRKISQRI